jgi:DNA invertase Pin-like site-specific DNA recombinase
VVAITEKTVNKNNPPGAEQYAARNVLRCAIYIRVSTAEQRIEGWSLPAQEATLRAEAEKKGWKVVGVYADEGKTARKRLKERKAIHHLLEDVKAGEIDVIIFKELDRWMRNLSDFYRVQDLLDAYGVKWYSQQQPNLKMDTKEDRLQVNFLLSFGQHETDAGSDRIKFTIKYLIQQKRWPSGARTLPRCYTLDEDQHVILDESPGRAEYVRTLVDNFFRYGTVQRAMKEANELHPPGMLYNNVVSLLRNPMLHGEYGGVPDFVEKPFMTKKEWERMQGLMTRNARDTERLTYIFAGLITCSCCGLKMAGTHTTKPTKKKGVLDYKYYRCRRAKVQGSCSNKGSLNEEKLEQDLMEYVKASVAEQIVKVKSVKAAKKPKKARKNNRESIELQLDKLEDLYITNDRMTKEKYEAKKAAILAKLIEDDEPEEKLPELADLEKIQALFDSGVEELYKDFSPEERRELWRGILAEIRVEGYKIMDIDFIE